MMKRDKKAKATPDKWTADRRLWFNKDRSKLVDDGHEDAATLYAAKGTIIPGEIMAKYKVKPLPATKAAAPVENKAVEPDENKAPDADESETETDAENFDSLAPPAGGLTIVANLAQRKGS